MTSSCWSEAFDHTCPLYHAVKAYSYLFFFSFLFGPGDQQGANRQNTTHKTTLNIGNALMRLLSLQILLALYLLLTLTPCPVVSSGAGAAY